MRSLKLIAKTFFIAAVFLFLYLTGEAFTSPSPPPDSEDVARKSDSTTIGADASITGGCNAGFGIVLLPSAFGLRRRKLH